MCIINVYVHGKYENYSTQKILQFTKFQHTLKSLYEDTPK